MQRKALLAVLLAILVTASSTLFAARHRMGPPDLRSLHVFDLHGNRIGLFAGSMVVGGTDFVAYLDNLAVTASIDRVSGELAPLYTIFFSEDGCQGQPFASAHATGTLVHSRPDRYFLGLKTHKIPLTAQSYLGGECIDLNPSSTVDAVPAFEVSLEDLGLSFPLPAPLYIAPD